jgi:hypothetical protein
MTRRLGTPKGALPSGRPPYVELSGREKRRAARGAAVAMPAAKDVELPPANTASITRGERAQFFRAPCHYALAFLYKCRHQPMVNKTIHEIAM